VRVTSTLGGAAIKTLGAKLIHDESVFPSVLKDVLGSLKGPVMKVAQILAMVPGMLPEELAESLLQLQSNAPPMGWSFVRRRMTLELGGSWQQQFASFDREACAAASLGQVHKAQLHSGEQVACKLQYPNMINAIQGDLDQLSFMLKLYTRTNPILDTTYIQKEIKERLEEELNYCLELENIHKFRKIFDHSGLEVQVPKPFESHSTHQLLTMEWMDGVDLMTAKTWPLELRQKIAKHLFFAWYYPLYRHGLLHGDPHFGNYRITNDGGIIMLDFGCVRHFSPEFLDGIMHLYRALQSDDQRQLMAAYEAWGFKDLTSELVEALTLWAKFLYEPLLEDRARPLVSCKDAGKRVAKSVVEALKKSGKVTPPKEFVFMDRAAVGIGSAMMHLGVELNWHQLFQSLLDLSAKSGNVNLSCK
jgi:predicted unusual protein kinase regulating ubiquinone biosynthesis (AarF/ABC1/UbiB family)